MKNKKQIKAGIIWGNPYCHNLGVEALAYSSIILLEEVGQKCGVTFHYTVWGSNGPYRDILNTGQNKIRIRNVRTFAGGDIRHYLKLCAANPLRLISPLFLLSFLKFDLVADIGAGDSYSDIYGITRFRNFDFTKAVCRRLKKKLILMPQTLGPFTSEEAHRKSAKSIREADMVFARDRMSYECVKSMLPEKHVEQSIDMAFFLPYTQQPFAGSRTKVGINISGLLWHGGLTQNNQFGLKCDYRNLVYAILDYFSGHEDMEIHLIAHVIGEKDQIDEDSHIIDLLKEKYPATIVAPRFKNPIEAKSYISGMDFFTGARMHACIAAISSGVPVFPLAYSRKFNGLFYETLQYRTMGDMVNTDGREILKAIQTAFDERTELKKQIGEIISNTIDPKKKELVQKLSIYIRNNEF